MQNEMRVSRIIESMTSEIKKHGLELLQRYPNDLLVHDQNMLQKTAVPGMKIAWMVGDSHTHMVPLGLHPKENEAVTYHLNLCNSDRFYQLDVRQDGFQLKEIDKIAYAALQHTPVPYHREGTPGQFWLYRGKERVGYVCIARSEQSTQTKLIYTASVTPVSGCSKADLAALELWANYETSSMLRTLFFSLSVEWQESIALAMAA